MRRVVIVLTCMFVLGCNGEGLPTAPIAKVTTSKVDTTTIPYRHPSFTRNTSWLEDNIGMTLVYERGQWANPWSLKEVTDTNEAIRAGWKAQRFEVRSGDCYGGDCTRNIVYERNEFAQVANENVELDEYWYAWSFYVPANIPQAGFVFYAQFQQRSKYDSIWMFLKRAGEPFCAIFDWTKNNMWNCTGQKQTYPLIQEPDFAGRWHDVVVHAKWTLQNNGFTRIYIDDVLMVDYKGYTRTFGNDDVYFKYGIYRHGSSETSVVYYDEIRRGKTREEVDIRLLEK